MKKSKVIIPALAMIGLSSVASITGSVAWFTAQRTGRITTGDFVVTKIDGDLGVAVTAGVGTVAAKAAGAQESDPYTVINPKANTKSFDVSFNPSTKQLWNDKDNGTSFVKVGDEDDYQNLTESVAEPASNHPYVYSSTEGIYYAYTWKITISMSTAGSSTSGMNVFFDYRDWTSTVGSKMTPALAEGEGSAANETSKGFRIAMTCGTKTILYAGLEETTTLVSAETRVNLATIHGATEQAATQVNYGSAGANSNFAYFASDKYADGSVAPGSATAKASYAVATDAENNQSSRADYLGHLTNAAPSIDVYCVAWYEGTDPNIVNGKTLEKVSSQLGFYSTTVAA